MRRTFALSLLALLMVAGQAFAVGEGRIQGKVTDAVTHAPVPDVTITINAVSGRTVKQTYKGDKDGVYRFLILDATLTYNFTWSAPGYQPYEEKMKLKLGEMNEKNVELVPGNAAAPVSGEAVAAKVDPAVLAYNEGAQLANDGKVTEAIAKIESAVAAKADFIAGYEALAKLYMRSKQYNKAIDAANKALAISSDETDMYAVLADAYSATGDKAKAAEARKKLPADANSMFNDAAQLINAGKDSQAEPLLKQAIATNDKLAAAYYELGMLYVRTGKNAEAKANLQKYLELEPNGKEAATAKEMLKYVK